MKILFAARACLGLFFLSLSLALNAGDTSIPKAIYGPDDRKNFYELTDPRIIQATRAVGLVTPQYYFTPTAYGYHLDTDAYMVPEFPGIPPCPDEPFRTERSPLEGGSAFLISDDVIVTAAHVLGDFNRAETRVVFGFQMVGAQNQMNDFSAENVYSVQSILCRSSFDDYCVARLDRPVTVPGVVPLKVRQSGSPAIGQQVGVIGHPWALPIKAAFGSTTRISEWSDADYLVMNTDTFAGNSGSPIVNASTFEVEGILVSGDVDYMQTGPCFRSATYSDSLPNEAATRITLVTCLRPLSEPTSVSATISLADRVRVSFATVFGAARYEIWRNTVNSAASAIRVGSTTTASFDDVSVASGRTYFYWVKSVTEAGIESVASAAASGSATAANPPAASVTSSPSNQTKRLGGAATFTAAFTGGLITEITWEFKKQGEANWTRISEGRVQDVRFEGATTRTLTISPVSAAWNGAQFRCSAYSGVGAVATSLPATLTVAGPTIVAQPATQNVWVSGPLNLQVNANGSGTLSYQWYYDGAPIANATAATYARANLQTLDQGDYMVVVSDANGSAISSTARLVFGSAPPSVTLLANVTTSLTNQPITLTATASDPDGTIQNVSFFNGVTKLGERTTSPFTHTFSAASAGALTVTAVATDNSGLSTTSAPVTINVIVRPVINSVRLTTTGDVQIDGSITTGVSYVLEGSTNLSTWGPLQTNLPRRDTISLVHSRTNSQAFFRLRPL